MKNNVVTAYSYISLRASQMADQAGQAGDMLESLQTFWRWVANSVAEHCYGGQREAPVEPSL